MPSELNNIRSADIVGGGVLIAFTDGRYAIYSADLLISVFPQAERVTRDEEDDLPL